VILNYKVIDSFVVFWPKCGGLQPIQYKPICLEELH